VDLQWLQRLNTLMALAGRAVFTVGLVLVAGVVLTLGNTLRLAIENRRDEIVIIKLIGGSNAFVRRPFLYTGLWYGLGGGIAAALMVCMALWYLGQPVSALAELYQSDFRLQWRGVIGALEVILIGAALGLAGAWLAVSRHLGEIEPR
jgi:cell division transport system permease protein